MKLTSKQYDVLKWIAQYLLPAFGTLYFALAGIWGLPYGEQIVGTVTAIDTFLGVILGLSSAKYEGDGSLVVSTYGKSDNPYHLYFNSELADLANQKTVTLKVSKGNPSRP